VIPAWELVKPHLLRAAAEAKRLHLGVAIADVASSPDVATWFAGLGEVEDKTTKIPAPAPSPSPALDSPALPDAPAPPRRVSLAVLGRPTPARQEVRAQVRKTGDELKAIFPALFEASGGTG
jgi:hypothetical protein